MNLIRVRPRGLITLPREVRRAVGLGVGDYLTCEVRGDAVLLRKAPIYPRASFEDGIWKLVGSAEDREGKDDVSANKHKYLGKMHRRLDATREVVCPPLWRDEGRDQLGRGPGRRARPQDREGARAAAGANIR